MTLAAPLLDWDGLRRMLTEAPSRRLWVVGDLILDQYLEGPVERISPEAPIQVVQVSSEFERIGGAGNVAHGCAALGAQVSLCGAIGRDPEGDRLLTALQAAGIDTSAVARVAHRPTTRKLRVVSRNQQIVRLDWEQRDAVDPALLCSGLDRLAEGELPHAILLSDYAKGVLSAAVVTEVLERAARLGVPVIADPKLAFHLYRGAMALTPNLRELRWEHARLFPDAGSDDVVAQARRLVESLAVEALVVTQGGAGMTLCSRDGTATRIPALRLEVCDITGAGDTVLAALGLGVACGMELVPAARIANLAAGLAVAKVGTAVVRPEELAAAARPTAAGKILGPEDLAARLDAWRSEGHRIVFTNGCFDLLHAGHLHLLREAAGLGDVLLVGLNSDASVARLKGKGRPLVPAAERAEMLAAIEMVDGVVVFDQDTPLELIDEILPDVLVKGSEWAADEVVGRQTVESRGGTVVLVERLADRSTTRILARVRDGEPRS